jgi:hypothetical protein
MTITLAALRDADPSRIRAVADHFEALAHLIDGTVADLSAATRDLANFWSAGPGAAAARQRDADLRQQLATAYQPVELSARVIKEFAGNMEHCRQMLDSVVAEAESKGFRVDLTTGVVTGPAEPIDPIIGLQGAQSTVEYYVSQLDGVLAQADEFDRIAAIALDSVDPGGLELQTVLPRGYLQWDGADIAGLPAGDRADWWHRQNPLTQEQYAAAYPDVVGSAEGIPSRYRDMANRILLDRRHAQLVGQEQELSDRNDGAGTPMLQQVQLNLAATERLQAQLDDPTHHGYLVDYRPGDEQHATLTTTPSKWDALWVE